MTSTIETVRIAVIQAAPVIMDLDATVEKALTLISEAKKWELR